MAVSRKVWPWTRTLVGVAVLAVVVWKLGAQPFLYGFASITALDVLVAALLGCAFTVASAWRWSLVAQRLGLRLTTREGVPAYYRSQFLNDVLPGGVLGDVHRAVRHGRDEGDLVRGARSVVWERFAGQVVQNVAFVAVLLTFSSPLPTEVVTAIGGVGLVLLVLGGWLLLQAGSTTGTGRLARLTRVLSADLRTLLARPSMLGKLVVASAVITGGHVVMFLIALHATGSGLSFSQALPLTVIVLAAASIPGSLAGWGPREGVAAWVFAAAGVGAAAGVAATSLYALMRLVSTLPGAVLLLQPGGSSLRGTARAAAPAPVPSGGDSA